MALSGAVPGSDESVAAAATGSDLQRQLWSLAGQALDKDPNGSATRLYVDALNAMIDQQTVHLAAMSNRVPGTVLALEVLGAAAALGLLAVYLAVLGRGVLPVLLGATLVAILLFVTWIAPPEVSSRSSPPRSSPNAYPWNYPQRPPALIGDAGASNSSISAPCPTFQLVSVRGRT